MGISQLRKPKGIMRAHCKVRAAFHLIVKMPLARRRLQLATKTKAWFQQCLWPMVKQHIDSYLHHLGWGIGWTSTCVGTMIKTSVDWVSNILPNIIRVSFEYPYLNFSGYHFEYDTLTENLITSSVRIGWARIREGESNIWEVLHIFSLLLHVHLHVQLL